MAICVYRPRVPPLAKLRLFFGKASHEQQNKAERESRFMKARRRTKASREQV